MYMEEVNSLASSTIDYIVDELIDYDLTLNERQEDHLYTIIAAALEKIADYPEYKNYN